MTARIPLSVRPLTRAGFAPFGDVIETADRDHYAVNDGRAQRFHDLATVDVLEEGGRPLISIFRSQPAEFPIEVGMIERHPLSSQAFIPLSAVPFLVVVAPPGDAVTADRLRAFLTDGTQGVNYHRAVWHHPLLALEQVCDFLVVDRGGEGRNCDEFSFVDTSRVFIEKPA